MPSFTKGPDTERSPFGKNVYWRSTRDLKYESYTFSKDGIPLVTLDGSPSKILQSGVLLAKITSGPEAGKVGVFDSGATDGRQTVANAVGINDTFTPWQLLERDVEVAACYEGALVQAWCYEYVAGVRAALTNATRDAVRALPNLALLFR